MTMRLYVFAFVLYSSVLAFVRPVYAHEHGIYAFGWGTNFLETPAFKNSALSGMTAYFAWSELEPKDGVYDFHAIDRLIAKAKADGKRLNIGIYPGAYSPLWIYERNVKKYSWYLKYKEDRWRHSGIEGESKVTPLPWDETYLQYWNRFVARLAVSYKDNDTVGYISLTGPTIETLSTGTILETAEDWRRIIDAGYSIDKLYDSWVKVIDHYHLVFQGKKSLVLALGPERPRSSNTELSRRLTDYVIKQQFQEIAFMSVFLNDTWFNHGGGARGIRRILQDAKEAGYIIGYQMAAPARTSSKWNRDFRVITSLRKALDIGIADGASWIEVWHTDIYLRDSTNNFTLYNNNVEDIEYGSKALLGRN